MEQKFTAEISIGGTSVPDYDLCVIEQSFNDHHRFELRLRERPDPGRALDEPLSPDSFVGKTFTIAFGRSGQSFQLFSGLITRANRELQNGHFASIRLSGYSPTVLLDSAPSYASFYDRPLDELLSLAQAKLALQDLQIKTEASSREATGFQLQYGETDFQFLNRLALQFNEWFYYTGTHLQLGRPAEQQEFSLVQGRNLERYTLQTAMVPLANTCFGYPAGQGELAVAASGPAQEQTAVLQKLHAISLAHYPPGTYAHLFHTTHRQELQHEADAALARRQPGLMRVEATSNDPGLHIGSIATIEQDVPTAAEAVQRSLGSFVVTTLTHRMESTGKYENSFSGVPRELGVVSDHLPANPRPELELAEVIDNQDPAGRGKIRVRFCWPAALNDPTDWIRVAAPSAGGSAEVARNRGHVFIPEVGDQVLIGFEGGSLGRPVVVGSVFTGQTAAGGAELNTIKCITTRSGHRIEFNDADNQAGITITDRSQNHIHIDTTGNHISITANQTLNLNGSNIRLNATENLEVRVGQDLLTDVGGHHSLVVGKGAEHHILGSLEEHVGRDKSVRIQGQLMEETGNTIHRTFAGDLLLQSSGTAALLGAIDAKVNKS
ncbi:hypothetical protein C7T94_17755 [Pedobacter yulinensis]|uniref:Gp5/Type VI secretion system Vgr protein OB-fold domain-containing protein n=1 Tax=Pedobacter yulinensis TaxID=2126353 RepID=A0A2T3HH07_9SPHI|nr:phage baseplate assembly protein V [Pedobacter yulinensis]PST81719.1 hypothetical protein C7T94_17755 [Pedobacter yulinensis]